MATWRPDALQRIDLAQLPEVEGVRYVISWQQHGDAPIPPAFSARTDITIVRTDVVGLSANRNNAIDHCTSDYILNADDDMAYDAVALTKLLDIFNRRKDLDFFMCQYANADGRLAKDYPVFAEDITEKMPRGLWCGTVELAFNRNGRLAKLRFEPLIGPGTETITSGEDEYLLLQARRLRGVCRFVPLTLGRHLGTPHVERRPLPDGQLRSFGFYITAAYPDMIRCRIVLKALRLSCSFKASFFRGVRQMLAGRRFYIKNFRKKKKSANFAFRNYRPL